MATKTMQAPATAKDVRQFFAAFPELVPTEAAHTVDVSAKGRIHPAAREVFNECSGREYTEGTKSHAVLPYTKVSKSGARLKREAMIPKADIIRLSGRPVSKRGPLSKAELSAAADNYAKSL